MDLTKNNPTLEVPESETPQVDKIAAMYEKALKKFKLRTAATKPKFQREKVRAKNKAAKKARRRQK